MTSHNRMISFCKILAATSLLFLGATAHAQDFNDSPPNSPHQVPAFKNQTRAPVIEDNQKFSAQYIARRLEQPWGMVELPDNSWLVTERPGRMRHITLSGKVSKPISGLPEVDARGQGGLLDVTISPDFATSRRIFWSYSEPRRDGTNGTSTATGTLSADNSNVRNVKVIFRQQPGWRSTYHFGSRIVIDPDGMLYITTGDRSYKTPRDLSQDVRTHIGKVIRITPDGDPAPGNPEIPGGQPEIWSWGHRNIQAAALGLDGKLWTIEHGPRGGDELNQLEAGKNYGWPIITYGENYDGSQVLDGLTQKAGMEQPVYYWDPVIAPSGMAFYSGNQFPEWQGDILVGGLVSRSVVRLVLKDGKVVGEARHFEGLGRIRDVAVAQDGAIMVLTAANNGALIKITTSD